MALGPIAPVTRDLGIDHQAGRFRRIPVLKTRCQKAKQRRLKLRALRLPSLNRLRFGVQSVAMWGVEAQGLAPRYRTVLRQALGKHLGHHEGGLLDVIYDLHAKRYQDPGDQIIISHVKAFKALLDAWPTEQSDGTVCSNTFSNNNTHGIKSKALWQL